VVNGREAIIVDFRPRAGYRPPNRDKESIAYFKEGSRKANPEPLGKRPLIVLAAGKRPPPPGTSEEL